MRDTELYSQILGIIKPWRVSEVRLDASQRTVTVKVELQGPIAYSCPECDRPCSGYDSKLRRWRHLDTCQFQTILEASTPRCQCPEHGVKSIKTPWAEKNSRFTALFERLVIDWLLVSTRQEVAQMLGLSWDEVHGILDRAVRRGLVRRQEEVAKKMGIDEKSYQRGHEYVTVVSDLEEAKVLFVEKDKKRQSLDTYFQKVGDVEKLRAIEAIAMDMSGAYYHSVLEHVPGGAQKIVFDKYHIVAHLNQAVDQTRRNEAKQLGAKGKELFKKTRFWWLRKNGPKEKENKERFEELKKKKLKTARAWALKDLFEQFWECADYEEARGFFKRWFSWASRSQIPEMVKVAQMLKNHLENILTYFRHRVTNAMAEGMNSKIQQLIHAARGFRNVENFITAIYFYCGKLDLHPQ